MKLCIVTNLWENRKMTQNRDFESFEINCTGRAHGSIYSPALFVFLEKFNIFIFAYMLE